MASYEWTELKAGSQQHTVDYVDYVSGAQNCNLCISYLCILHLWEGHTAEKWEGEVFIAMDYWYSDMYENSACFAEKYLTAF